MMKMLVGNIIKRMTDNLRNQPQMPIMKFGIVDNYLNFAKKQVFAPDAAHIFPNAV